MLVLNRKRDQGIVISGNIRIRVLSVKGNTVRLGIEAPSEVSILRNELCAAEDNPLPGELPVTAAEIGMPAHVSVSVSI